MFIIVIIIQIVTAIMNNFNHPALKYYYQQIAIIYFIYSYCFFMDQYFIKYLVSFKNRLNLLQGNRSPLNCQIGVFILEVKEVFLVFIIIIVVTIALIINNYFYYLTNLMVKWDSIIIDYLITYFSFIIIIKMVIILSLNINFFN